MKSFTQLLSFGLIATCASAVPLVQERQDVVYALSISTKGDDNLNGQTLEVVNSVFGVYPGDQTAAQVYPVVNQKDPALVSLHTYPIGIIDHFLALKGDNGLFSLVDESNPSTSSGTSGSENFILKDGLVTQNLKGGWLAFPSGDGWVVEWYDGSSIIIQDYVPVDIVYKPIKQSYPVSSY